MVTNVKRIVAANLIRGSIALAIAAWTPLLPEANGQAGRLSYSAADGQTTNGVSLLATGLPAPSGLTLGPQGRLFVTDSQLGKVYRIGDHLAVEAEGFVSPQGTIVDTAGNLYVADTGAGTIYRLDTAGNTTILAANLVSPCCLGFDRQGNLLVVHATANGELYGGTITRLEANGQQTVVASGFLNLSGVVVDREGGIIVAAEGYADSSGRNNVPVATGSGLYRIDELGQVSRLVDAGSITPRGLTLSPQGTLFFSGTPNAFGGSGSVFLSDTGTFAPFLTGLSQPRGLAADSRNLYVADAAAGAVWKVDLKETAKSTKGSPETGDTTKRTGVASAVSAEAVTNSQAAAPEGMTVVDGVAYVGGEQVLAGSRAILSPACRNQRAQKADEQDDPHSCHPVNLRTGVKDINRTDLVVPGVIPIVFGVIYRTGDTSSGSMGIGCSDTYDYRMRNVTSSQAEFQMPNNQGYFFYKQPDGSYINTNQYWLAGAKLYDSGVDGPTRFTMRFKDGTRYIFSSSNWGALSYILDANNNQLSFLLDGSGNLSEIRQPNGRSVFVTVDGNSNIKQVQDSAGRTVSYVYSNNFLVAVTNAVGGVTSYTYTNNNLRSVTLPSGVQFFENTYDSYSRVVTQTFANAGTLSFTYFTNAVSGVTTQSVMRDALNHVTTYNFNTNGQWIGTADDLGNTTTYIRNNDRSLSKVIDPLGRTNSFVYDAAGNVTAITNAQNKVTRFAYETTYNRLTSVVDPLGRTNSFNYDGYGNLTSIVNALGKTTQIAYNSFGLPTSVADPLGNTSTFSYSPMLDLESVSDPLGNQVKRYVDAAGRPSALVDPLGRTTRIVYTDQTGCGACSGAPDLVASITDPLSGATSFKYDANGNLTNVTDALNHSVNYGYDNMDQLTSRTDQLGQQEIYRYDKAGNVTNFVDRRGVAVTFKYDTLDRRTGVVYGAESNVRYFYDKVGRVTNVTDSIGGAIRLTYDSLDRLTQENNNNGTVSYSDNDVGLRTNMAVTGQSVVGYWYDPANRLTNVLQGTFTSSLAYDDTGRRTNLTLLNSIKVLYRYDSASRLTNLTYQAAVTNKIDYTYDDAGNRSSQQSAFSIYNLPSAISNSSYNAANQQLTFGGYTIQYDANGNMTNIVSGTVTNRLVWSARNQLTNMTGSVSATFQYDGLGRRQLRTVAGTTENYLYDGLDIIQQLTNSGTVTVNYFRGLAIDEPWLRSEVFPGKHGNTYTNWTYLADALGSVVALTDANKAITTDYDYEPFGSATRSGSPTTSHYTFTGREDDGTGLMFYRARYYNPALNRFVSEDPIEYAGGDLVLYAYARSDPMTGWDPLGLWGAEESYDYWVKAGSASLDRGGLVGNAQAVGASAMTGFIDFFWRSLS